MHLPVKPVGNAILLLLIGFAGQISAAAAETPAIRSEKDVKWGAPPPVFPAGAKFTVIAGDPAKQGLLTVRFEMPAGYVIPPHFHATDEHVTVLKGTFFNRDGRCDR